MMHLGDDIKISSPHRAITEPPLNGPKTLDIGLAPEAMIRATSDVSGSKSKWLSTWNKKPKNFTLTSRSLESIDVHVPPREIMNKIPFYDVPLSSVYGSQQTDAKLASMKLKLKAMGFKDQQALVGLILTQAKGITNAVNVIMEIPSIPADHDWVSRIQTSDQQPKKRHGCLALNDGVDPNCWPWNVEDEKLCAYCGLPGELFHKGDIDLSKILGEKNTVDVDEKQPWKKESAFIDPLYFLSRGLSVDEPVSSKAEYESLKDNAELIVISKGSESEAMSSVGLKISDINTMITCGICFDEMEKDKIFLAPCKHYYCKDCLRMHYRIKIMDGDVLRLPCPHINEFNEHCRREIEEEEILNFCDDEMKAKFKKFKENKLIQLNEYARFCPKAGCEGWTVGSKWNPKLTCDQCGYTYCWSCSNEWHGYFSRCVDDQDGAFIKFTMGRDIQTCPKCRVRIWKNDGCNHMTCKFCKYEFCWLCRGKYTHNHFEPWNLMGCPGAMYYPSWLRCPHMCPRPVHKIMMFLCFIGFLTPIAIAFVSSIFSLWITFWLIICIPFTCMRKRCLTPCECLDMAFD